MQRCGAAARLPRLPLSAHSGHSPRDARPARCAVSSEEPALKRGKRSAGGVPLAAAAAAAVWVRDVFVHQAGGLHAGAHLGLHPCMRAFSARGFPLHVSLAFPLAPHLGLKGRTAISFFGGCAAVRWRPCMNEGRTDGWAPRLHTSQ